ncbi:MAG: hypothetical protein IC227_05815 [Enterococcus lacertideformus]|uniref:Uncharacterized protein n=1 Tax=Enterococcus lacertideformus TaxID=2771493 RepID=A0A931B2A3_9ENTE|nr:hypothetical protein [Enterococcus lacertideformus]
MTDEEQLKLQEKMAEKEIIYLLSKETDIEMALNFDKNEEIGLAQFISIYDKVKTESVK